MKSYAIRAAATALLCSVVAACGGGGGGDNGAGGGGGGSTASTYSVALTDVALTDARTGETVDVSGLPIQGATVTKD